MMFGVFTTSFTFFSTRQRLEIANTLNTQTPCFSPKTWVPLKKSWAPCLLPLRPQLLRPVADDPLQLLDTLHHLGHRAGAVDELAHFGVRELVGRDQGYQADRFSRTLVWCARGR